MTTAVSPTLARAPVVHVEGLTKRYVSPSHVAVEDLSLDVELGEILCLLGPSGCGKTTLLRLLAGFEMPDAGAISIHGRVVAGPNAWVPPEARSLGFVFQDYALFPHLTVQQNVAFGLQKLAREARAARAAEVLDLVGLTIFASRYPHQLSGGQQQRVALARALAPSPAVILMDEPFSNLDAALRGSTRDEVRAILQRTGTTAVLVTHDQEEALTFADRIAVMRAGRLEQVGSPEGVYSRPRTAFVANFLGRTNLLRGEGDGERVRTALGVLPLSRPARGQLLVSLRPEALRFENGHAPVQVQVLQREFKGHDLTFTCQLLSAEGVRVVVQTAADCHVQVGDTVGVAALGAAVPLEGSNRPGSVFEVPVRQ